MSAETTTVSAYPEPTASQMQAWPLAKTPVEQRQMAEEYDAAHPQDAFPVGYTQFLDQRTLLGVPFAFRMLPLLKKEPAKQGISKKTGLPYHIDAQEVMQFLASLLTVGNYNDPETWGYGEPQLVTVKGGYLVNQLRGMSQEDLEWDIWTFARNTAMPAYTNTSTQQLEYPIMLRRWRPEQEAPAPF